MNDEDRLTATTAKTIAIDRFLPRRKWPAMSDHVIFRRLDINDGIYALVWAYVTPRKNAPLLLLPTAHSEHNDGLDNGFLPNRRIENEDTCSPPPTEARA